MDESVMKPRSTELDIDYSRPHNVTDENGQINSVYPCTDYLTFGPWIYMVPQYKPSSVLMLGYAGGTTAGLINLIYKDVPITAVDLRFDEDPYEVEKISEDAREFIKTADKYDTVIVDMFEDGSTKPCKFIFTKKFAKELKKRANYLIIHADENSDMKAYEDLYLVKVFALNGSRFYYYMVNDIASLPIR